MDWANKATQLATVNVNILVPWSCKCKNSRQRILEFSSERVIWRSQIRASHCSRSSLRFCFPNSVRTRYKITMRVMRAGLTGQGTQQLKMLICKWNWKNMFTVPFRFMKMKIPKYGKNEDVQKATRPQPLVAQFEVKAMVFGREMIPHFLHQHLAWISARQHVDSWIIFLKCCTASVLP